MSEPTTNPNAHPGLARRCAAMAYDSLLLFALLMLATAPWVLLLGETPWEPLPQRLYQLYLLGICYGFFGWFWTQGGQTLGMRAWRLQVQTTEGQALSWADAGRRFGFALLSWLALGLGFIWLLFDPEKRTWHDRLSGTRLRLITRER